MSFPLRRHVHPWRFIIGMLVALALVIVAIRILRSPSIHPSGTQTTAGHPSQGPTIPAQEAYLKSSYPGIKDTFGESVAIDGDTVVVGVPREDSSTGINSMPNEATLNAGAAYVFVRSGSDWTQQAYLKVSNPGAKDFFGSSVALNGDTIVIGAYAEDSGTPGVDSAPNESAKSAGAAYVFVRSGTTWTQQAYLKASNAGSDDNFGSSVAVHGDTIIIGASGAAYIFVRSGTTWIEQAYLRASNPGVTGVTTDAFGRSVAIDGDTVIVGAAGEDSSSSGVNSTPNEYAVWAGAAYVFVRSGSTWTQQAYLKASNPGAKDFFGTSVAVSGNTIVVGARNEASSTHGIDTTPDDAAPAAGAAYVFVRSGSTWTQQAYLKAANGKENDLFGISVAVSGETVIVGAMGEDGSTTGVNSIPKTGVPQAGAAYVFARTGTIWTQHAYVKASNPGWDDKFGFSVALDGTTAVVGALHEDSSTSGIDASSNNEAQDAGAAYIFGGLGAP